MSFAKNKISDPFSAITGQDAVLRAQRVKDECLKKPMEIRDEIEAFREISNNMANNVQKGINAGKVKRMDHFMGEKYLRKIPVSKRGELAIKVAEMLHEIHEEMLSYIYPGAEELLAISALEERQLIQAGQVGLSFLETSKVFGKGDLQIKKTKIAMPYLIQ